MWNEKVKLIVEKIGIENLDNIVAIVGAGASVASGLKTFRGEDGLYEGKRAEDLASRHGFYVDPSLVWTWYKMRIEKVMHAEPNPIHKALARLEQEKFLSVVITQNVDGLHTRAGQRNIIEIHGNILQTHCFNNCGRINTLVKPPQKIPVDCDCGSFQRPSVVWFGESLNPDKLVLVNNYLSQTSLVLIIGTSGFVYPVAQLPIIAKNRFGARIIEFNLRESSYSQINDLFIEGPAEHTFPEFVKLLVELKSN